MHKPLRIIKDDARVRLTQQVNLTSAVRAALLTLPENFSETDLFERIAGISYNGDPRMMLPAENRGKVGNIVKKQSPQFRELYHRLVVALPGVHWAPDSAVLEQDTSAKARAAHLRKLPAGLLDRVKGSYEQKGLVLKDFEGDEAAYWVKLAGDERLAETLSQGKSKHSSGKTKMLIGSHRIVWNCSIPCNNSKFEGNCQRGRWKEPSVRHCQGWEVVARIINAVT